MKIKNLLLGIGLLAAFCMDTNAQNVGIGTSTPLASAKLHIEDANRGLMIPRVALTNVTNGVTPVNAPATGLLVFNTNLAVTGGNGQGFYYWDGTIWQRLQDGNGDAWLLNGNAGTVDGTNFIGTTDNVALNFKVNNEKAGRITSTGEVFIGYQTGNGNTGTDNTGLGFQALYANTIGFSNTANGARALYSNTTGYGNTANGALSLYLNTTGYNNTANGGVVLRNNTTGSQNTASGSYALYSNTSGYNNTANGMYALYYNTTGYNNTANGLLALYNNTTGNQNTAVGLNALQQNVAGNKATAVGAYAMRYPNNTATGFDNFNVAVGYEALRGSITAANNTGNYNTALGYQTLISNTSGNYNTANGYQALFSNTTGYENTASGQLALYYNSTGNLNTANGRQALYNNTTGNYNTASGQRALYNNTIGYGNTASGIQSLYSNTTGDNNTASGYQTLYYNTTGYYNTAIGRTALQTNTTGYNNTASGAFALYNSNGSNNVGLGNNAGAGLLAVNFEQCTFLGSQSSPTVARTNVTMLGYGVANAQCTGSNQVLLGNTAIASIRAQVTGITGYSDARFKINVKEDVKGLEFIMKLKPVTYNQDPTILHRIWGTPDSLLSTIDHSEIQTQRFIGFLAQDVEKAAIESGFEFPGIDVPRNDKEVYSLRYADFIMPMIKAMQEQQKMIDDLKNENEKLEAENKKMNEELKAEIEKLKLQLGVEPKR